MLWVNDLLRRHAHKRWCVVVDPDEFLVYPNMETRSLHALAQFLEDDHRPCLHALLIDAYSDRPLAETWLGPGDDPFAVCPFFDRDGYLQRESWGNSTWVQGGPRMRAHFADRPEQAPALNKIPLVRWKRHYHYNMSTHDAWPRRLNRAHAQDEVSTTGALFHFKLVAALESKAAEEAVRERALRRRPRIRPLPRRRRRVLRRRDQRALRRQRPAGRARADVPGALVLIASAPGRPGRAQACTTARRRLQPATLRLRPGRSSSGAISPAATRSAGVR